eukprot:211350_1
MGCCRSMHKGKYHNEYQYYIAKQSYMNYVEEASYQLKQTQESFEDNTVSAICKYILMFEAGSYDEKILPTTKQQALIPTDIDYCDPEWHDGIPSDKYIGQIFNRCWQQLETIGCITDAYRSSDELFMFLTFTDFNVSKHMHNAWTYTLNRKKIHAFIKDKDHPIQGLIVMSDIKDFLFPLPATISELKNIYDTIETVLFTTFNGNKNLSNIVIGYFGNFADDRKHCVDDKQKFGYIPFNPSLEFIDIQTLPEIEQ